MAEINAQLNAPNGAGGFDVIHPQTNLKMVSDMSAFMRLLGVAADATAARNQLGVKELTPPNLLDALHSYGTNYVPADTSNAGWNALGFCSIYYDTVDKIKNQPSQYGQLINLPALGTTESTQLWISQLDGRLMTRRGNGDAPINDQPFSDSSGGGIIAQSLQQNGWAKFANGLIIQWGLATAGSFVTLPIAARPKVVLGTENVKGSLGTVNIPVNEFTDNGFTPYVWDGKRYFNDSILYFALC